jgi:L-asparaginase
VNSIPEIAVFSTGGTFNKVYNPLRGQLEVDAGSGAIEEIMAKWHCRFELHNLLHKDSLEMNDRDREELTQAILGSDREKILIIHGTDTIDWTAATLEAKIPDRQILLTGAMIPYSIDPVEATANFAAAVGWLLGNDTHGIYVAMHGLILPHDAIYKNRSKGIFLPR